MSAVIKTRGDPSKGTNIGMANKLQNTRDKWADTGVNMTEGGAGNQSVGFPAQYSTGQGPNDSVDAFKSRIRQGAPGGAQVMTTVPMTDAEIQRGLDRHKQGELFNFDSWYATTFDPRDFKSIQMARKTNPGYFKRREDFLVDEAKKQLRLARIKMLGPTNEEDFHILYLWQTGQLDVRNVPLHRLDQPPVPAGAANLAAWNARQYKRGIFNPMRGWPDLRRRPVDAPGMIGRPQAAWNNQFIAQPPTAMQGGMLGRTADRTGAAPGRGGSRLRQLPQVAPAAGGVAGGPWQLSSNPMTRII